MSLEIGSSKVLVVVGSISPNGTVHIIGKGEAPAKGVDKGIVNDLDAIVESITMAVAQAEAMTEEKISNVILSISGAHIQCANESGMITVGSEISQDNIDEVIHTAKSIKLNDDMRLLHVIPQDYTIDGQEGIKNPKGLSASRLNVNVHLITCNSDMLKNLIKAVEKSDLSVQKMVFSGLASSYAVATNDEKELGVCVVDIGAGTMDISVYTDGYLRHSMVIPHAGGLVTSDITKGFKTSSTDAEALKIKYGSASKRSIASDEKIDVPSLGDRPNQSKRRTELVYIIESRYLELFQLLNTKILELQKELKMKNIKHDIAAGIILTGGGSQISDIAECAKKKINHEIRVGYPRDIEGLTDYVNKPSYSTAIGLLHYAKNELLDEIREQKSSGKLKKCISWMTRLIRREFD